jgi:hypothetical protein
VTKVRRFYFGKEKAKIAVSVDSVEAAEGISEKLYGE